MKNVEPQKCANAWNIFFDVTALLYFSIWGWHKEDWISCSFSVFILLIVITDLLKITYAQLFRKNQEQKKEKWFYNAIKPRNIFFNIIVLLYFAYVGFKTSDWISTTYAILIVSLICCYIFLHIYLKIKEKGHIKRQ